MSGFESKNLAAIRAALDHHNKECPVPANAIRLNPVDHALMGWDELWGLPVLPDERVPTKNVRIDCDGSAWGIEDEVADAVSQTQERPIIVPVGPREDEPQGAAVPPCRACGPASTPRRGGARPGTGCGAPTRR